MVLVGNKCDLEKKREVSFEEGKDIGDQYGCPFVESSAKNDININDIFLTLIEQTWEKNGPPPSRKEKIKCLIL